MVDEAIVLQLELTLREYMQDILSLHQHLLKGPNELPDCHHSFLAVGEILNSFRQELGYCRSDKLSSTARFLLPGAVESDQIEVEY